MRGEKRGNPAAALILFILILLAAAVFAGLIVKFAADSWRNLALWILGAVMLLYLLYELRTVIRVARSRRNGGSVPSSAGTVSALVLMNEKASGIKSWDLRDKTGLAIGRSADGADVDIDLSGTEYFSLISGHHAVLNFTDKGWLLTDAGSKNGTALLHTGSRRRLLLAPGEPVPIRPGDTIFIAEETALAVK